MIIKVEVLKEGSFISRSGELCKITKEDIKRFNDNLNKKEFPVFKDNKLIGKIINSDILPKGIFNCFDKKRLVATIDIDEYIFPGKTFLLTVGFSDENLEDICDVQLTDCDTVKKTIPLFREIEL